MSVKIVAAFLPTYLHSCRGLKLLSKLHLELENRRILENLEICQFLANLANQEKNEEKNLANRKQRKINQRKQKPNSGNSGNLLFTSSDRKKVH
jgi:hypothetical protein